MKDRILENISIEFETKLKYLPKEPSKDIEPEMTKYLREIVSRYDGYNE